MLKSVLSNTLSLWTVTRRDHPGGWGNADTRSSTPPKPPLQLIPGQLHDRRPPVHVVRRERRRQEPAHELAHLLDLEPLACLDRCPTGEAGREALESVGPAAEAAAREIRYQLLEAARRVKPRVRVGSRVHDHGPPGKRLDLVSHAPQQLPVG